MKKAALLLSATVLTLTGCATAAEPAPDEVGEETTQLAPEETTAPDEATGSESDGQNGVDDGRVILGEPMQIEILTEALPDEPQQVEQLGTFTVESLELVTERPEDFAFDEDTFHYVIDMRVETNPANSDDFMIAWYNTDSEGIASNDQVGNIVNQGFFDDREELPYWFEPGKTYEGKTIVEVPTEHGELVMSISFGSGFSANFPLDY